MFGMDLGEILVIAVVAILFLGPDKLPGAMVELAKFFKSTKNTISSIKDSFEEELNVKSMKDEALAYKKELLDVSDQVKSSTDIKAMAAKLTTLEDDSYIMGDSLKEPEKKAAPAQPQEVTLKKSDTAQATNKVEEDKKNV
ncbi:MAG: Sec-independent protein translocase protein TatB [Sulfurimonas sp.]|uniref:Sec-independent protein translocase protein TatB n=1 Tax=Sulfurimonas sp. TaxID=2022749 RepID=UPI00262E9F03|nr:Sec-independent protein translocase protein TatB [Sulfurimonas sp.]MDD5373411.1 Sec-independent protein translocase protein TatB [Sulfurimonas sp.]